VSLLQRIQELQYSDAPEAARLTRDFIAETFGLEVVRVTLRPSAVSLNSFNGFCLLGDGRRLFFKTHTESHTVITEYYNAAALATAGYPVIEPLYSSTIPEKQLLLYDVVEDPSLFEVAWELEEGIGAERLEPLRAAQGASDDALLEIYRSTLEPQRAPDAAEAPIHQLFHHRITGGRLREFYGEEARIALPSGEYLATRVRQMGWRINGRDYSESIEQILARAARLLAPAQPGPSVWGHGDAHNGNVFWRPEGLVYFDPAFAGRHHPLLDLTKPLFHNVFATWMYYPGELEKRIGVRAELRGETLEVEYDDLLPPVRRLFLDSKIERVLTPLLAHLADAGQLRPDWRAYLKAALFCCPLLTRNLGDPAIFPPAISVLGLAIAVEMGSEGGGVLDGVLDEVELHLSESRS
jgi:hypothetical protein